MCAENGSTLRLYGLKCSFPSVKYSVLPSSASTRRNQSTFWRPLAAPNTRPTRSLTLLHQQPRTQLGQIAPSRALPCTTEPLTGGGAASARAHQICPRPAYPTGEGPGPETALVRVFPGPIIKGSEPQSDQSHVSPSPQAIPRGEEVRGLQ